MPRVAKEKKQLDKRFAENLRSKIISRFMHYIAPVLIKRTGLPFPTKIGCLARLVCHHYLIMTTSSRDRPKIHGIPILGPPFSTLLSNQSNASGVELPQMTGHIHINS